MIRLGRHNWETFAEGVRKEWLVTNGLGGFASGTVIGANTRKYHGLLFASLRPPTQRTLLLSQLLEEVTVDGIVYHLATSQWYAESGERAVNPRGYHYLESFALTPLPTWVYSWEDLRLYKTLFMVHGYNATVVRYRLVSPGRQIRFKITALANHRDYHATTLNHSWPAETWPVDRRQARFQAWPGASPLFLGSSAGSFQATGVWWRGMNYLYEEIHRGESHVEDHYEVGYFLVDSQDLSLRGSSLQNRPGTEVVFTVLAATIPLKDFLDPAKGSELEAAELARRAALLEQAGVTDDPGGKAMTRYYQAAPAMGQRTGSPGHDASDEAPPSHPREGSKGPDETPRPPAKGGASYRATGPNVIPAGDQELSNDGEVGFARALVLAAADFIVQRQSTGTRTIIAGYPWFTDWGRDTMIALPGLTLVTGRYEVARELLLTFARYCRDGLIPNLFPERGEEPLYNTIDASLWYFHAVRKYLEYTGDYDFILREIYPVLQGIVAAHLAGTRFNIEVDPEDGLLAGGRDGLQLTWMDAKIDGRVVTPREGKPVEVNALWYNALRVMEDLAGRASAAREQAQSAGLLTEGRYVNRVTTSADPLSSPRIPVKTQSSLDSVVRVKEGTLPGMAEDFTQSVRSVKAGRAEDYRTLAERVKMSFQKFWYAGGGYLYDVLTNAGPDPSLRPNQIMAVSLPYSPLTTGQAEQVVRKVWRHLYTTYGLRTLAPGHPDYKGQYDGDRFARDAAYHQGTAWAWLVGPFVTAYCRVHHWSPESRQQARAFLLPFREHLFDAGLGTISEIFSGNPPHTAVGCLAQAWSVGEVLRAWVEEVQGRKPPNLATRSSPANVEAQ